MVDSRHRYRPSGASTYEKTSDQADEPPLPTSRERQWLAYIETS
jgi:hypothetical protein